MKLKIKGSPQLSKLGEQIKRKLKLHLKTLGYERDKDGHLHLPTKNKDIFRHLHAAQRKARFKSERKLIEKRGNEFLEYFASGNEIVPENIRPKLERIGSGNKRAELFRFATLLWRIPVSRGFGRRLRFLVWDENNGKLMGLIALGDPVFNMAVRDKAIGWTGKDRTKRLVDVMDAYILGAVPPYNELLCGKLVACLVKSKEIVDIFDAKYKTTKGLISGKRKHACLAIVTTTSAFGRSSIFNRLKIDGEKYLESVGYTSGWGHFHVPDDLFEMMTKYLRISKHRYAKGFEYGDGPNWRLRTVKAVLDKLNMKSDIMKHGIAREVFLCRIAKNADKILRGETKKPKFSHLKTTAEIANSAVRRWVIPRASTNRSYLEWDNKKVLELIKPNI
jgi:hypothetical protein